ncbi:hypothetical protein NA56DRAFT_57547 [Hyaloscypha hepaticicola]|uniref:Nucleoside transporter family n=1 Tax=Hyaloscypha hepaticicola TaxID=2082293 RepID=A0A2J6PD83_9HELO|nr:hypothetical protein NA56DRAFT_57547 [Hyaloscypha hepaticicola]
MDRSVGSSSYGADKCYEPFLGSEDTEDEYEERLVAVEEDTRQFALSEYIGFFTIGLSMMWTWSMILQAVPYLQQRFETNATILRYFQASYLLCFAIIILLTTVTLSACQEHQQPAYRARLKAALCAYVAVAALLMLSTIGRYHVRAEIYFPFTLAMVVVTAVANGLSQNAAFAFAAGFGRTEYAPAIMTGEALAGLLPSVIEIVSALAFPSVYFGVDAAQSPRTSVLTLGYFLSAMLVGMISLGALGFLIPRSRIRSASERCMASSNWAKLFSKLQWPALANFSCLCISSVSPVFVAKITSVVPEGNAPILLRAQAFIPLAIILWNIGDLVGSVLAVSSRFLIRRPFLIFIFSLLRIGFIPLYLICNIDGNGSLVGDWFYLVIVQFLFGVTHGWLSGASMMGVPAWVSEEDREAAGAFMGMTLVGGLVAGSMLGLAAARA